MPSNDPAKRLEYRRRYRKRKHEERFGPGAGNMQGRHSNHARGPSNPKWNGGRFVTSHGYVAIRVHPNHAHAWGANPRCRYAYEHIIIAEALIGRQLREDDTVHHRNGDRADNRPDNLEVLTRSDHAKEHDAARGRDRLGRFPRKRVSHA